MKYNYEDLANAIIVQVVKEYRSALRMLVRCPNNKIARYTKREIESFLLSDWYSMLTSVDPKMLIRRFNEEVNL